MYLVLILFFVFALLLICVVLLSDSYTVNNFRPRLAASGNEIISRSRDDQMHFTKVARIAGILVTIKAAWID